jgi:cyclophilin family peptidyl-prolyl cis-trans isomerase
MATAIAQDLANRFEQVTVQHYGLLEVDWLDYLRSKTKEFRVEDNVSHRTSPLVFYNTLNYIGGEQELIIWAQRAYRYNASQAFVNKEGHQELNTILFRRLAKREYAAWLQSQKSQFVYMDLKQGAKRLSRVVFELFSSLAPRICQNFVDLCTGSKGKSQQSGTSLTYQGSVIHRVVNGTWIQGGDICGGGGDRGESASGEVLPDENFAVKHDKAGVLAMANSGPHSNHSQFYVTLLPMPWLDCKNVAFGRVIQGMRTMNIVSKAKAMNQRPLEPIVIEKCGLFMGGEDGGILKTSAKRPVTQRALLKHVFIDALEGDSSNNHCRYSELLIKLRNEGSTLHTKFSGQAEIVISAVESDAVNSGSDIISINKFVEVGMNALMASQKKLSTPQRKLDEALAVDAKINAPEKN